MKLSIEKSNNKYFIILGRLELKNDKDVANALNMTQVKYRKTILKKFFAHQSQYSKDCFFIREEEAQKALDWANSIIVFNKLNV